MRRLLALALAFVACQAPEQPRASRAPAPSATESARPQSQFERLYYPEDGLFEKKRAAQTGDWLERFPEKGQSFLRYRSQHPVRPTKQRRTIVLQPLGSFAGTAPGLLETLRLELAIFFELPVTLSAPMPLPSKGRRARTEGGRRWTQLETSVLLDQVLAPKVPENAVIVLGVTMTDLYPEPSWNYVFGEASLDERVGVYSLARFYPAFWGEQDSPAAQKKGLARSFAVLAHETGHAFGMEHCTEYECIMNGSNSLEEPDRQFGELCPVCLRKLAWNIGFDPVRRYEKLRDFYRKQGLHTLADWMSRRLDSVGPR